MTARQKQYLISIGLVLLVSAICYGISAWLGYRVVAFILLLTVSLIAISFDILPVLLSATLSAFIWDFFFIPPRFTFQVGNTEDAILLIMYFIIAMISAVLTYKIRQIEKASLRLNQQVENLLNMSRLETGFIKPSPSSSMISSKMSAWINAVIFILVDAFVYIVALFNKL